jgi:hypothetical protein
MYQLSNSFISSDVVLLIVLAADLFQYNVYAPATKSLFI